MTEREQSRNVAKRLAMIRHFEEVSGNVAKTCRYYGISRPTFYKWFRRYQELGPEGLRDIPRIDGAPAFSLVHPQTPERRTL